MYKNKPKPETKQATLARIKEEMDEPRMANPRETKTSTRPRGRNWKSCRNHPAKQLLPLTTQNKS
jgi:hypothetical protein